MQSRAKQVQYTVHPASTKSKVSAAKVFLGLQTLNHLTHGLGAAHLGLSISQYHQVNTHYIYQCNAFLLIRPYAKPSSFRPSLFSVSYTHLDVYKRQLIERPR